MYFRFCKLFIIISILTTSVLAFAELPKIGVLGDSYSESYKYFTPHRSKARNWVEILNAFHRADFGPIIPSSFHERANRFSYNFAEDGDTSSDTIDNGRVGELLAAISSTQLQAVIIEIGGDDFLDAIVANTLVTAPQTLISNVQTIISQIHTVSPALEVFVCLLPDVSLLPLLSQNNSSTIVTSIKSGISRFNKSMIDSQSTTPHLHTIDLRKVSHRILSNSTCQYAHHVIDRENTGDSRRFLFLDDDIHIGTIAQALVAEEISKLVDAVLGRKHTPLSAEAVYSFAARVRGAE